MAWRAGGKGGCPGIGSEEDGAGLQAVMPAVFGHLNGTAALPEWFPAPAAGAIQ